ncbi:hrp65 protein-like [Chrysoperla carnea]|uniref:hrp65 protein-like n=1 Tax=Chrysoperla carnea TaxID=189513 RepID=UPI001D06A79B|nr:hrp65 protein-like [Chrysoperla carnea]
MAAQEGIKKNDTADHPIKQEVNTPGPKEQRDMSKKRRGGGGGRWHGGGNRPGGGYNNQNNSGPNNNQGPNNYNGGNQNRGGAGDIGPENVDQEMDVKRGGGGGFGGPRNNQRFNNTGGPGGGPGNRDREYERINERLMMISGSTLDLQPLDTTEKKFAGRNRLYIGNLTNDITEDEINELFKPYGETSELFLNKEKMFAFIRLDYHANAERAKRELDGQIRKGRPIKIRFAPNASSIKVKNLTPYVTNELLHTAFSVFGDIERCVVIVDERGKSTCEGIVEFARKPAALCAIRRCTENCFFLTSSLRPVIVEAHEIMDDIDGFSEKGIGNKKSNDWYQAREVGPRFASPNSFEHQYGTRWKQLNEIHKQKLETLKREQLMEEEKLEAQMEYARYEHETEMLREQLRARELDKERQKREWEMKERAVEEEKIRSEEQMRRLQEDMLSRMNNQEDDFRRRQEENSLFLKAHQLTDMLDQQERYDTTVVTGNDGVGMPPDPKVFMDTYDRGNDHRMDDRMGGGGMGGGGGRGGYNDNDIRGNRGGGNWGNIGGRRDDYQNKRRRY